MAGVIGAAERADSWDPERYERFKEERSAPFFDLLALVRPRPGMRVVDLGCGSGELTRELHNRLQAVETTGFDNSPGMLERSSAFSAPGLRFEEKSIEDFADQDAYDLVFTNAALQWLPAHQELFGRLTASLRAGGQIAVQMPANDDYPTHRTVAEIAGEEPFHTALNGYVRPQNVLAPEDYAVLLEELGYRDQHVRLQVYGHHLKNRLQVIEWVRGTLLTGYQSRLPAELFEQFLNRYREVLVPLLDDSKPFFYPFKRILLWGKRQTP